MVSASSVLLAVLCSTLVVACFGGVKSSRILGGEDASTNGFPYIVSVRVNNVHVCGGSIIANQWILTAAHCVAETGTNPVPSSQVTIRAGSTNSVAAGKLYNIQNVNIHNSFGSFLNDIALLKTATPLELGPRVQPIAFAESEDAVAPGDVVTVAGWGRVESAGQNSFKLQFGDASVISAADCEESIAYGYPSTLCLESPAGKGTCTGDAGGPAVTNNVLVGVSNFVIGTCGTKYPDVFAKVSTFSSWIKSTINA